MEMSLKNISYKNDLSDINLTIKSGKIIGIYPKSSLVDIITCNLVQTRGELFCDSKLIDKYNFLEFKNRISVIDSNNIVFYTTKVKDEINYYFSNKKLKKCDYDSNISLILNNIGFDTSYLNQSINSLSNSEKYMLFLKLNLFLDLDIVCFNELPTFLDKKNRNRIIEFLKKLKENEKIVLFNTSNVDLLYSITDETIIIKNRVIDYDDTKDIFTNEEILIKNNIELPTLVKITYLAKKEKNVKLFYHTDVRDIIKDIYKHV